MTVSVFAVLLAGFVGAQPVELVQQLQHDDTDARTAAKEQLIELREEAVEALVDACFTNLSPSHKVRAATIEILAHWDQDCWSDPKCRLAIDKFIRMARDPTYSPDKPKPLSSVELSPFLEAVRIVDIAPQDAAAYLRVRGVRISEISGGYYSSVTLTTKWVGEPKDWLYIANLAREIEGTRQPIAISVNGPVKGDKLLECLKNLRKVAASPFSLFLMEARIDREMLHVLRSYPGFTSLTAVSWADDISDEDWAQCISAWPNLTSLCLSPTAGPKAIAAATERERLISLVLARQNLTEADLAPLRNHKTLQMLQVRSDNKYVEYINQKRTGVWQVEDTKRPNREADR